MPWSAASKSCSILEKKTFSEIFQFFFFKIFRIYFTVKISRMKNIGRLIGTKEKTKYADHTIGYIQKNQSDRLNRKKVQYFPSNRRFLKKLRTKSFLWVFFYKIEDAVFSKGPNFCTKFDPLNDFFKRRASYHFKA